MRPAAPVTSFGPQPARPPWRSRLEAAVDRLIAPVTAPLALLGAMLTLLASRLLMPTPGTIIRTVTRPGPSEFITSPGATYFVVGQSERGRTDRAIEVRSILDARNKLGGRVAYGTLDDDLAMAFSEGITRAFVARVVGGAATKGFLVLQDRAGAPLATLRVEAIDPGAWSSGLTLQVLDGSLGAGTFRLRLSYAGAVVEDWDNLASPANAVAVLNAPEGGSTWVKLLDQVSVSVAPQNNPAVLAATALSAGTDDRAAIVTQTYLDALARFTADLGDGIVAIPGQTSTAVGAGLLAHIAGNQRIAVMATAVGQTVAQAKAAAVARRGTAGHEGTGLAFPWVYVPDGAGGRRLVSPEGYVAGVRARAHRQEGPWRAPAGDISTARYVLDVEGQGADLHPLTDAETEDLTRDHVIPIRRFENIGVQVYGWRSLSKDTTNYRLLTGRDVLNRLAVAIKARTDRLVFGTIDGERKFLEKLDTECRAEVEPMANAGGLYAKIVNGVLVDPGYTIDTGPGVNTDESLALDEAAADVAARVSPTGETIRVTLAKVSLTTAL